MKLLLYCLVLSYFNNREKGVKAMFAVRLKSLITVKTNNTICLTKGERGKILKQNGCFVYKTALK